MITIMLAKVQKEFDIVSFISLFFFEKSLKKKQIQENCFLLMKYKNYSIISFYLGFICIYL